MQNCSRRDFLKKSILASVSISYYSSVPVHAQILGANNDIRVGVVGFRSKGAQHIEEFRKIPGVRIVALCDVDKEILDGQVQNFKNRNETVTAYADVRQLLDDKNIDAVVIATPNHWHSLIAIWACQAGKDVYVEKPVSHNIWEGYKLVEAARKYNRIVQSGTQNRSDIGFREAVDYIAAGNIGRIQWAYGLWFKERDPLERVQGPQPIPASVDYDLWLGPAEKKPLTRKNLHYDWHWFWDTGNGDMGNLGVHQIDDCRFALGLGFPERIMSLGGRFVFNDGAETPNTQMGIFDYRDTPVYIEIRNLPVSKGARGMMDHFRGIRDGGNIIQCQDGYFAGGRGGGWIYDNANQKIKQFIGDGGGTHSANFIESMRSRISAHLHAPILQGHTSSALCHIANISYRIGRQTANEEIKSGITQTAQGQDLLERMIEHLSKNGIDWQQSKLTMGPWLEFDDEKEKFVGAFSHQANKYLKRKKYRKPFVIPKKM
jgi:predicted dehydrogenase